MPIIIISSDAAECEQPIAEGVAKAVGYRLLGPDILPDIAARRAIPAEKLTAALDQTPSAWRPGQSKSWLLRLACIEADVLDRLRQDNIVCWGLAAHLYVLGVSHALKVRLLTEGEKTVDRIAEQRGISPQRARHWLESAKRKRSQWSKTAFGQNEAEPSMYDLAINLGQIDPDEVVRTIAGAVAYRKFQPMTYSLHSLADLALAAEVKTKLLVLMSDVRVEARDGKVVVTSKAMKREREKKFAAIKALAGAVKGVDYVEVHLINYVIRAAAESNR